MPLDDRAIAISATFTAEAIQPGLAFWIAELGLEYGIRFAGYNTLFQQLLDPAGLFASNRGGINVALARFEDWQAAGVDEQVRRLAEALRLAAAYPAPLVLAICPPSSRQENGFDSRVRVLRKAVADLPGVFFMTPADLDALYPVGDPHDPHGEELGNLPYTPVYFAALATAIARKIHAIVTPPYKVAALDCDETLWAGICGEDGPQGVVVDPPRRALQEFMAQRRREGMLLALCSKNNEEDVMETFRALPGMPLRLEDFAAWRINWDSKADNLAALAAELELGMDSFILVDDNPKECTEAQAASPGLLALSLPARAEEIPEFLKHVWAFDRERITEEDLRRPELYQQRAQRTRAAQAAGSLKEFLASLQLEIGIAPVTPAQLPRVAQLTARTNQMNATLARRTEPELRALLSSGAECLAVTVADRFGDYGLAGAIVFRVEGADLRVDAFLLSCRALGRGVEHRMVARLGEIASERGLEGVEIPFVAGQRNRPAALFLESLRARGAGGTYQFPAAEAAAVRYKAGEAVAAPPAPLAADAPPARKRIDYARIAAELRDPHAILERIRRATRRSPRRASYDSPRTPLEKALAELWAGLLNLPSVGVHDNFFDLGGHSLLAVQLLSRVRQAYGVDLSLEVVYSGEFTVAELAKAIELKEIEQAGAGYQDLIQEIEALSDEEARHLLAEEQGAS
ncbi:MAG: HAD-IIIC family phosphatase [Bryobacteraceae bacterium]|jgi:FkbH-like protein